MAISAQSLCKIPILLTYCKRPMAFGAMPLTPQGPWPLAQCHVKIVKPCAHFHFVHTACGPLFALAQCHTLNVHFKFSQAVFLWHEIDHNLASAQHVGLWPGGAMPTLNVYCKFPLLCVLALKRQWFFCLHSWYAHGAVPTIKSYSKFHWLCKSGLI